MKYIFLLMSIFCCLSCNRIEESNAENTHSIINIDNTNNTDSINIADSTTIESPVDNEFSDCLLCDSSNSLSGTKWKLADIIDAQTGVLRELEPKDCEKCYSFTFDTDSTAAGWSTSNVLLVSLKPKVRIFIATDALGTDFYLDDAILFHNVIGSIITCELNKNELKFYYNDNNNYLLFKQQ